MATIRITIITLNDPSPDAEKLIHKIAMQIDEALGKKALHPETRVTIEREVRRPI